MKCNLNSYSSVDFVYPSGDSQIGGEAESRHRVLPALLGTLVGSLTGPFPAREPQWGLFVAPRTLSRGPEGPQSVSGSTPASAPARFTPSCILLSLVVTLLLPGGLVLVSCPVASPPCQPVDCQHPHYHCLTFAALQELSWLW